MIAAKHELRNEEAVLRRPLSFCSARDRRPRLGEILTLAFITARFSTMISVRSKQALQGSTVKSPRRGDADGGSIGWMARGDGEAGATRRCRSKDPHGIEPRCHGSSKAKR